MQETLLDQNKIKEAIKTLIEKGFSIYHINYPLVYQDDSCCPPGEPIGFNVEYFESHRHYKKEDKKHQWFKTAEEAAKFFYENYNNL